MATKGPLVEAQPTAAGSGIHSLQPGKVHDRPITLPLSHIYIVYYMPNIDQNRRVSKGPRTGSAGCDLDQCAANPGPGSHHTVWFGRRLESEPPVTSRKDVGARIFPG